MTSTTLLDSLPDLQALSVSKLFNVEGWVALVTGGGTGLGLVTAAALAQNGARVYITGRRLEVLENAAKSVKVTSVKGEIIPIQADVSTKEGIQGLRDEIEKKEKWINVLINNHGVSLGSAKIDQCEQTPEAISKQMFDGESFEKWNETYKINTASYHFTTFAFFPLLANAKRIGNYPEPGNIVNLASMSGLTSTSQHGQFNYNCSKAATILLSKMQATEFARKGLQIRVNCINPGYFPSGMSVINLKEMSEEEAFKHCQTKYGIPFGRTGSAQDYAQCIFGIISNQYMTGAEILIDGGWMTQMAF